MNVGGGKDETRFYDTDPETFDVKTKRSNDTQSKTIMPRVHPQLLTFLPSLNEER